MKKIILILLIINTFTIFSQTENIIDKKIVKFFKSEYKNPVIEKIEGDRTYKFPRLKFYSVIENENLSKDLINPDMWVVTTNYMFFRTSELEKALKLEKVSPLNENEAFDYSMAFAMIKYNAYYYVAGIDCFSNIIPKKFRQEQYFPKISYKDKKYITTVYFYFNDECYSEFYSTYKNKLVEYTITIDTYKYSIIEKEVTPGGIETDKSLLNQCMIELICEENLFAHLKNYLEKRAVYGITDPPDNETIRQRRTELDSLWNFSFLEHQEEIYRMLKEILDKDSDYMFNTKDIFEKTKDCLVVKDIEYYESTLDNTLQDIMIHFREYNYRIKSLIELKTELIKRIGRSWGIQDNRFGSFLIGSVRLQESAGKWSSAGVIICRKDISDILGKLMFLSYSAPFQVVYYSKNFQILSYGHPNLKKVIEIVKSVDSEE